MEIGERRLSNLVAEKNQVVVRDDDWFVIKRMKPAKKEFLPVPCSTQTFALPSFRFFHLLRKSFLPSRNIQTNRNFEVKNNFLT